MANERRETGDPARTLELLWREPGHGGSRRGPRQGLTVDAVVRAAVELADTAGLEALTMRGVARELGVTPMTLYTYVPGKAELLALMLDAVYLRMPRGDHTGAPWRTRVEAVAHENRDLYGRHPWVATLPTARPPLGPGLMTKYEHELAAFDGLGLDDVEMDAALTLLLNFVQSVARATLDTRAAARDSAMSDEQWWAANEPLLAKVFDPARFPLAARVGSAAGAAQQGVYSPEHAFTFGLQRILDGLAHLMDRPR
ncbi:transcriptional regulator, TetR family [Streptomyces sp. 2231.1]|uniref:TetR/AcrR family transcriptional regulator n=1 Tax=Streptomyces sp. 2231.1 TaxID=1855347 RepID=UPI000896370C|nr:TetR/AcrR family transcriptional regulator [Streptomyces sp. 2231.1]SEC21039.1 transcriptional regulator, TetR family [Streptomyces sp. 2231.1]